MKEKFEVLEVSFNPLIKKMFGKFNIRMEELKLKNYPPLLIDALFVEIG